MRITLAMLAFFFGSASAAPPSICLIGDSITLGESSPMSALRLRVVNAGVGGSSTWDWLPGSDLLEGAKRACGSGVASIMLGTNDALISRGTTAWQYRENLREIASDLADSGFAVVLNYPPPTYGENRNGAMIAQFDQQIDMLVDGISVFAGSRSTTQYFEEHRSLLMLRDGVHPNPLGTCYLAVEWARYIEPLMPEIEK